MKPREVVISLEDFKSSDQKIGGSKKNYTRPLYNENLISRRKNSQGKGENPRFLTTLYHLMDVLLCFPETKAAAVGGASEA